MANISKDDIFLSRILFLFPFFSIPAILFLRVTIGITALTPAVVWSSLVIGLVGALLFLYTLWDSPFKGHEKLMAVPLFLWVCTPIAMGAAFFFTLNPVFIMLWHIFVIAIPILTGIGMGVDAWCNPSKSSRDTSSKKTLSGLLKAVSLGMIVPCCLMSVPIASLIILLVNPAKVAVIIAVLLILLISLSPFAWVGWFKLGPGLALSTSSSEIEFMRLQAPTQIHQNRYEPDHQVPEGNIEGGPSPIQGEI